MESAIATKQALRAQLLEQRRQTSAVQKKAIDDAITQRVLQYEWFAQAQTIFVYYSTEEEIATHALIQAGLRAGKVICLPKCLSGHRMEARQITSLADLTEQTFGIPEPGAHCAAIPREQIDLCIVPALACDREGYRLGYGGGFYDRFLDGISAHTAALCVSSRIYDILPRESFDIPCSRIYTENEVILP